MASNPPVLALLEMMLESGKTAEEVCRDCPELLAEVRQRWQLFCRIDAGVKDLLPALRTCLDAHAIVPVPPTAGLPRVPGYEVEAVLGRGGMGVVYRARHVALKRTVALKMLAAGHGDASDRARFRAEAEAVARLQHPNIVQIHEVGEADGLPFLALEFVEGGSLADRLAGGPVAPRDAARLVGALAEAMHLAHSRNLVHRDLKPANVLLAGQADTPVGQCQPKVTDFGLVRQLDADSGQTFDGVVMGTPSYMAPEQAEGRAHAAGPAADVYALGAILYECLTGRPPFHGDTPLQTLEQVRSHEPAAPSSLNRPVPRDLETICLKCLRKQPDQRYSSARELADDLGRFLRGEPVAARSVGVGERTVKWVRRRPALAGLLVALVLLGTAAVWMVQQRAERRAETARRDAELGSQISTAVDQAETLRQGYHFQESRELLKQARGLLGPPGPEQLLQKLEEAGANLEVAEKLDRARLRGATLVAGRVDPAGAEPLYEKTFAEAGLGGPGDDIEAVAARVGQSVLRTEIVAALDDWASITQDGARLAWLLAVARAADPDPFRDRLRQPKWWGNDPGLPALVEQLKVEELSPQLATAVGRILRNTGREAVPLLGTAQTHHPQDFWLNYELGWALTQARRYDEAMGFYQAALALRPDASPVYNAIGLNLRALGRLDEAIRQFQQGLKIDSTFALAHQNLGLILKEKGRLDEAIGHWQEAIRLDPEESSGAHCSLGAALHDQGQIDEAIHHFRESIRLNPKASAFAHTHLGTALWEKGERAEVIGHFEQALRLDPGLDAARYKLYAIRYAAARAAVQASAAQGPSEKQPSNQERARLRRQALAWLQANLDLRAELLKKGQLVYWSLAGWQTDPALATVRDRQALAKLPETERVPWQRLWTDLGAVVAADPLEQGRAHATRRAWDKAADCYARALERRAAVGDVWFEYAAILLLAGDRQGYASACAHMLVQYYKAPFRGYHVARACTLAPDAVSEPSLPGRLAEAELNGASAQFWSLTEQGALQYRAGRFPQAVELFEQSLRANSRPGAAVLNWLWLALAEHRQGKSKEARRWLNEATDWLDQYRDGTPDRAEEELGLHLHNWLEAHVLRREAEALIRSAERH